MSSAARCNKTRKVPENDLWTQIFEESFTCIPWLFHWVKKRSARLSTEIYKALAALKDYGFKDQITRSSLSIPSNIAEGYERESNKETANFLNYAKGSAGELRTQIYIGMEIGYIDKQTGKAWIKEATELSKMLSGFIKSVRNRP